MEKEVWVEKMGGGNIQMAGGGLGREVGMEYVEGWVDGQRSWEGGRERWMHG